MSEIEKTNSSLIKTYTGEIYIIKGKTPAEVQAGIGDLHSVEMPNGDMVKTAHIAMILSRESYKFQIDQKQRHKRGQHISGGAWRDDKGLVTTDKYLEEITGRVKQIEEAKQAPEVIKPYPDKD